MISGFVVAIACLVIVFLPLAILCIRINNQDRRKLRRGRIERLEREIDDYEASFGPQ